MKNQLRGNVNNKLIPLLKDSVNIIISQSNFETTFERNFIRLVNYANSFLCDSNLSEDLVQEVFLRVWENRKQLQIKISFEAYLFRSIRNKCLNYKRHRKCIEDLQSEYFIKTESQFVLMQVNSDDNIEMLYKAIEYLSPKCQRILYYRLLGLKNREIADIIGVSLNTLKTQKNHAYRTLRTVMGI